MNFTNNTVASNDTTASAGTLFNAYFAGLSSDQSPPPGTCINGVNGACTASAPQPAGLSASPNSPQLSTLLPSTVRCPSGHAGGTLTNGDCRRVSYPLLSNNIFWQNRAFHLEVGGTTTGGTDYQQSLVTLHPTLNQPSTPSTAASLNGTIITGGTGACVAGATYWDIGVRGDTGPTNHSSGFTLTPQYSVLTSLIGYTGHNNQAPSALGLVSQYCNGSRMPPEFASGGYQVPPGTNEGTVPVPVFSLLPGATVDEGNNWVNMKWGPLAMTSPMSPNGESLGNYSPALGSPAIDAIPVAQPHPSTDFFGNPRPSPSNHTAFDAGAVELQGPAVPVPTLTSISPNTGQRGAVVPVTLSGTNLTGTSAITVSGTGINVSNITVVNSTTVTATFTISGTATVSTRTVSVTTPGGTSNTVNFTVNAGTLTFTSATNGTLASFLGVRTLTFNVPSSRTAVTSVVTMTNTGPAPLQITAETITANSARFSVTGTTCSFTTPLAAGAACTVTVRYATPASRPLFPNLGALTVSNNGTTSGLLALSGQ